MHEGSVSPVELTAACLERIERLEPTLNAFITVTADAALDAARRAERELRSGRDRGPLHGIPIALKDHFETAGVRTTAGSKILADHVPARDAAIVTRLTEAGAIGLGKTNLHEWAFGVTNDNPHFGPTRNPWDPDRIPGGSSGGSAAALAAGCCFGALGTDTGGSIRIPAALCGIVGLKPTYGRVGLRGVIPLAWSLDHAGPMARCVRDVALLLQTIAGYDPEDPTSADVPVDDYVGGLDGGAGGLRVGLAASTLDETDAEVADGVRTAADMLPSLGVRVEEVALPRPDLFAAPNPIIGADAAAYHRERLEQRPQDFGADVLERLRRGAAWSAVDYAIARRQEAELRSALESFFRGFDALLLPTTPISAPVRTGQDALAAAARLTTFTSPFNRAGVPALSVLCGFTAKGLPIGMQVVAAPWRESTLLRIGHAYEQATDWHARWPQLDHLARAAHPPGAPRGSARSPRARRRARPPRSP